VVIYYKKRIFYVNYPTLQPVMHNFVWTYHIGPRSHYPSVDNECLYVLRLTPCHSDVFPALRFSFFFVARTVPQPVALSVRSTVTKVMEHAKTSHTTPH